MTEFAYHLVGIGGSFTSFNLTALTLTQIRRTLEDTRKKIQTVLDTPLLTAIDKFLTAINLLQNFQVEEAITSFRSAANDALTAFHYAEKQGYELKNLRDVYTATKFIVFAKLCIYSYDKNTQTIQPFVLLDSNKQNVIATELERDCTKFLDYHRNVQIGFFSLNKAAKNIELESMKNELLKYAYPYISEGKKYTSLNQEVPVVLEIECNSLLMPEGRKNATVLKLGREKNGKIVQRSFYKTKQGLIRSGQNFRELRLYKRQTANEKLQITLIENWLQEPISSYMEFVQTTDDTPIFFAANLNLQSNFLTPILFLHRSDDFLWFCSHAAGYCSAYDGCILRTKKSQNTEKINESPPLTGWEYVTEYGEWKDCEDEFPANVFITLDSSDYTEVIRNPWAELDRTKFKDEIIITASEENIRCDYNGLALFCGVYKADMASLRSVSIYYRKKDLVIVKTKKGKWHVSLDLDDDEDSYCWWYNDTAPHSEWPPPNGWRDYWDTELPIKLCLKISPLIKN